ncbi:hypothetical protein BSE24067_03959 [Burkholderia seminalis]|nr:hypothetical protein BSE24067_03959 [Burkholderia seminalis]
MEPAKGTEKRGRASRRSNEWGRGGILRAVVPAIRTLTQSTRSDRGLASYAGRQPKDTAV